MITGIAVEEPKVPTLVFTVAKVIDVPLPTTAPVPPVTDISELVKFPNVKADCFALNVFQSALDKYPFVDGPD